MIYLVYRMTLDSLLAHGGEVVLLKQADIPGQRNVIAILKEESDEEV